ncbi:hypothetical protein [Olivibacter ginsenosidimutans]
MILRYNRLPVSKIASIITATIYDSVAIPKKSVATPFLSVNEIKALRILE